MNKNNLFTSKILCFSTLMLVSTSSFSYSLYSSEESAVYADFEAGLGVYSSQQSYGNNERKPRWQEAYVHVGLRGESQLYSDYTMFSSISFLSTGTWGDGDAANFTLGEERHNDIENAYIGVRSSMLAFSIGRQSITIGDGFLLDGDTTSLGKSFDSVDSSFSANRGGAYYLGVRRAFNKTAVIRFGTDSGLRSDLFAIESDNPAQASMRLIGINIEHVTDQHTVALMHLNGLDVDQVEAAFFGLQGRDGQTTTSVRYQGNVGIESLFLSSEYVHQQDGVTNNNADAWYAEIGWSFDAIAWLPSVNYRYSHYDVGYDPLFYGAARGYDAWFQGQVAANYAGPFSSGTNVHYLGVTATLLDVLSGGVGYFYFRDLDGVNLQDDNINTNAQELDIWLDWEVNDHLIISPFVGIYSPDSAQSSQGNPHTNTYVQLITTVFF